MESLKVFEEEKSIYYLQKLCIPQGILPEIKLPKAAKIFISENVFYLCQIFIKDIMHPSYCTMDFSVQAYRGALSEDGNLPLIVQNKIDILQLSNINVIQKISNIKTVSVTVILKCTELVSFWKNHSTYNNYVVKDLLKLFLLTNQAYIFLDCLKDFQINDIFCLYINSIGNIDVGHITLTTNVKIVKIISHLRFEQLYQNRNLFHLGGMERHSFLLAEIIQNFKKSYESDMALLKNQVQHKVLIIGPPGCGKTTLVKTVARNCRVPLLTISGPELSNALPGETEKSFKTMFERAKMLASEEFNDVCILLIEHIDSIFNEKGNTKSHLRRCTNYFLNLIDSANEIKSLIIMATTDRVHLLDPAVRRSGRLDHEIFIGVPTEVERNEILKPMCLRLNLDTQICSEVAKWTPGYVAADLAMLCLDVARRYHKLNDAGGKKNEEWISNCWRFCLAKIQPSSLKGQVGVINMSKLSLNDIGGATAVKQALKQAVEWPLTHPEAFVRLGLAIPKGILLYGPPGCAKTSLVRAISSSTNTTFLAVSAAEIYSPFVGDAEKTISELFQKARMGAPSILFIDEIDALVGSRGGRESGSQERVLSAFLTEMDGVGLRADLVSRRDQGELLDRFSKLSLVFFYLKI
uniref:AAA+ ATPase domain-containing protein n=1 Tax=Clastoptera arizonana TaxID=38151 RepID=A0A1B6C597_9HEMI